MYTLYVIPGSHACRSGILMLEHKQVPYRRVDIVTLLHPLAVRLHGFDAGGQARAAGGRRTFGLRLGDRLGTVPALACDGLPPHVATLNKSFDRGTSLTSRQARHDHRSPAGHRSPMRSPATPLEDARQRLREKKVSATPTESIAARPT
jgi:hypothetical protein